MARRTAHLMVSIALLAAAASGCGTTAPSQFYTLDPTALSDGAAPVSYPIMVGPVSVPAAVDRPEFVVQAAPNRVEVDEFNRWAAPLNDAEFWPARSLNPGLCSESSGGHALAVDGEYTIR